MKHLARFWRPQQFGSVVGQHLAVRLLKNSLYRDTLFPVYLFSGQRGTGKTTLARLFAAAVNCAQRAAFQMKPHEVELPCRSCGSCEAMAQGTHTDFIEIDAASHTGVDNVRAIIEAAVLSPQMGSKRIYLIDEAHMLSKAACNALLKTLEEPLDTVLFLMATTEVYKIPETVRSRCFQLFLSPHTSEEMIKHLEAVCIHEHILYETAALERIARVSDGSLRDALNMLERSIIAYERVYAMDLDILLGTLTIADILKLLSTIAQQDVRTALEMVRSDPYRMRGVPAVWQMLYESLRMLMLFHYGALVHDDERYVIMLKEIAVCTPMACIKNMMQLLYERELQMLKASNQQMMLELFVVQAYELLVKQGDKVSPGGSVEDPADVLPKAARDLSSSSAARPVAHKAPLSVSNESLWQQCLVAFMHEPLYLSMAQQGSVAARNDSSITVALPAACQLFEQAVGELRMRAETELRRITQQHAMQLIFIFVEAPVAVADAAPPAMARSVRSRTEMSAHQLNHKAAPPVAQRASRSDQSLEVTRQGVDPLAKKALELFPGTLTRTGATADE